MERLAPHALGAFRPGARDLALGGEPAPEGARALAGSHPARAARLRRSAGECAGPAVGRGSAQRLARHAAGPRSRARAALFVLRERVHDALVCGALAPAAPAGTTALLPAAPGIGARPAATGGSTPR